MYKKINYSEYSLVFNVFPKTAKRVSDVYNTGFHKWESMDFYAYSIVLGTFRIIFYIDKDVKACCR